MENTQTRPQRTRTKDEAKEAKTTTFKTSRICETLGVKVGESFAFIAPGGDIDNLDLVAISNGECTLFKNGKEIDYLPYCIYVLTHPSRVIHNRGEDCLADLLGVQYNERFKCPALGDKVFMVALSSTIVGFHTNGQGDISPEFNTEPLLCLSDEGWVSATTEELLYLYNHPEEIQRLTPIWSDQELSFLKTLREKGVRKITRDNSPMVTYSGCDADGHAFTGTMPSDFLFPNFPENTSVVYTKNGGVTIEPAEDSSEYRKWQEKAENVLWETAMTMLCPSETERQFRGLMDAWYDVFLKKENDFWNDRASPKTIQKIIWAAERVLRENDQTGKHFYGVWDIHAALCNIAVRMKKAKDEAANLRGSVWDLFYKGA